MDLLSLALSACFLLSECDRRCLQWVEAERNTCQLK